MNLDRSQPEQKLNLKNLETPEIKRAQREDPNPLNRRFGSDPNESSKQISLMLDNDRINFIEKELLEKMRDQITLGIGGFDGKDNLNMHLEKVPITVNK